MINKFVVSSLLALVGAVGFESLSQPRPASTTDQVEREVRARSFILVDGSGKERARLSVENTLVATGVVLRMKDSKGKSRFELFCGDSVAILTLGQDNDKESCAQMIVIDEGSAMLVKSKQGREFRVFSDDSRSGSIASQSKEGSAAGRK